MKASDETACEECQRLWHEYAAAAMLYSELRSGLTAATLNGSDLLVHNLAEGVETAAQARWALFQAIAGHFLLHDLADEQRREDLQVASL